MVMWMTTTENRLLDLSERRGYLVCRREQRVLVDQWTTWSHAQGRPVVRVEKQEAGWQLVVQWRQSPGAERLKDLKELLAEGGPASGLLPLVHPGGALSCYADQATTELLARKVAAWLSPVPQS